MALPSSRSGRAAARGPGATRIRWRALRRARRAAPRTKWSPAASKSASVDGKHGDGEPEHEEDREEVLRDRRLTRKTKEGSGKVGVDRNDLGGLWPESGKMHNLSAFSGVPARVTRGGDRGGDDGALGGLLFVGGGLQRRRSASAPAAAPSERRRKRGRRRLKTLCARRGERI